MIFKDRMSLHNEIISHGQYIYKKKFMSKFCMRFTPWYIYQGNTVFNFSI